MAVLCQNLARIMDELVPLKLAEEWDNVGLLIGDPKAKIRGVLVALDLNFQVMEEALERGADFIIVHHPPIFHPLKRLHTNDVDGKLLLTAARDGLNVYAAHTNLDQVFGGVSDQLAQALELSDIEVLVSKEQEQNYKLVVFVPETHVAKVKKAIGDAGAGFIGNYSHCTFRTGGIGTFVPQLGAEPYLGQMGQEEEVAEFRLETIVPEGILASVLKAMFDAHPYEEVAYDLYPLANKGKPKGGFGRIGNLPEPLTMEALVELVKARLSLACVKVVKGLSERVSRIAVCGGSGGGLVEDAIKAGAQALITGDVSYHQGQVAQSMGLAVIDAGHGTTEKVVLPALIAQLQGNLSVRELELPVFLSQVNTDPWRYY